MPRFGFARHRHLLLLILAGLHTSLGGCVAMNIPSVRYNDPGDRGGMLGPHRPAGESDTYSAACGQNGCGLAGCGCHGDDGAEEKEDEPPTPQVPWPRFHPLPTRPVFSSGLSEFP